MVGAGPSYWPATGDDSVDRVGNGHRLSLIASVSNKQSATSQPVTLSGSSVTLTAVALTSGSG